jgi:DNA-binding NarL/FixJ family response regulator
VRAVKGEDGYRPGLVILDLDLGSGERNSDSLRFIQKHNPDKIPVVIFTAETFKTIEKLKLLKECVGPLEARGVLLKSANIVELTRCFARMLEGETVIHDYLLKALIRGLPEDDVTFNASQSIAVDGLLNGLRDAEIAIKLKRSKDATRQVVQGVFRKLGVHTRLEAFKELEKRRKLTSSA